MHLKLETAIFPKVAKIENIFPGIFISTKGDMVVFMHAESAGVVIWQKGSAFNVGEYQEHWLMNVFKPFEGEVLVRQINGSET